MPSGHVCEKFIVAMHGFKVSCLMSNAFKTPKQYYLLIATIVKPIAEYKQSFETMQINPHTGFSTEMIYLK